MPAPSCSDQDFIDMFRAHGGSETARLLQINESKVYTRRRRLEKKYGIEIIPPIQQLKKSFRPTEFPQRLETDINDGTVVVASDCHYWPERISTAHRSLLHLLPKLKPHTVVLNGDVLDGAAISRFPPQNWDERPSLTDELETCKLRLSEIQKAAPKSELIWTLGNHDARFEMKLAKEVPEFAKVHGFALKDHFPNWKPCWTLIINDEVYIKHRWKGGKYAAPNNTLHSGVTFIQGHLHSLKVWPHTDYRGTRFGVDTGTMADPFGPQFDYAEDNPRDWRSGWVVLNFCEGRLLWPEVVHVIDEGRVEFQGEIIEV